MGKQPPAPKPKPSTMYQQDLPTRYISRHALLKFLRQRFPNAAPQEMSIEEVDAAYWRIVIPERLSQDEIDEIQNM